MDIIKIFLKLSDFATQCLWLLTLKVWFTSMFTNFYNYRFMNDRLAYITRTIRITNTQWFGMMTNGIYGMNISLCTLQELIGLLTFNGLTCWWAILALQVLLLLTIVEQTGLLTVNDLTSLLTLLTLQAFCLLTLLEHTALTGLHW